MALTIRNASFQSVLERGAVYRRLVEAPGTAPTGLVLRTVVTPETERQPVAERPWIPPALARMFGPGSCTGQMLRKEQSTNVFEVDDQATPDDVAGYVSAYSELFAAHDAPFEWLFPDGAQLFSLSMPASAVFAFGTATTPPRVIELYDLLAVLRKTTTIEYVLTRDLRMETLRWFYQMRLELHELGHRYFSEHTDAARIAVEERCEQLMRFISRARNVFRQLDTELSGYQCASLRNFFGDYANVLVAIQVTMRACMNADRRDSPNRESAQEAREVLELSVDNALCGACTLAKYEEAQAGVRIIARRRIDDLFLALALGPSLALAETAGAIFRVVCRAQPDAAQSPQQRIVWEDVDVTADGLQITIHGEHPFPQPADDTADLLLARQHLAERGWGELQWTGSGYTFLLPNRELHRLEGTELIPLESENTAE